MDLIYSWTPKEFKNFIKGAQLRQIDEYEKAAYQAVYIERAHRSKQPKVKDLYNAEKARNIIQNGVAAKKPARDTTRYKKAQEAMKAFQRKLSGKEVE